jgi:phage-related protein
MIGQMGGDQVAGQAKKAWDIMKQTPAVQWQIFIEKGRALLVMFGQELLPIFLSVVKVLQDIVKWFQNLSPETKKWIGYIVLAAGIILTVTGALFQMIGAILLVGSALVFTEVGIGVFLTTAGIILGVVAAIVIAGILIWRNWDKVKPVLITIWDALKTAFFTTWNAIKAVAIAVWDWVYAYLVTPFVTLIKLYISIWAAIFETVYAAVMKIWDVIRTVFTAIWGVIGPILGFIWELVKRVFTDIWETITFVAAVLIAVWQGLWAIYWGVAKSILAVLWALIKTAFQVGFKIIEGILKASWAWWMIYWHAIVAVWHTVGEPIIKAIGFVWHNVFYPIVKWVMETLGRAWRTFWDLIKSYWEVIGRPVFDAIKTAFKAVWDFLVNGFKFISDHWAGFWEGVKSIFFGIINSILAGIEGFVNGIISAINWVRTKFGLSPMGNVVLSRVGETGGGGGAPTGGKAGGRLAKGTDYWRGGWAWVGERGPELAYLPRGSAVIPNTLSMGINMANNTPGFAGGFLSGTVVNRALSAVGVRMPALPGVFQDLGPAIFDQVTDWFKNGIKYILGGGTSAHSGGVVRQSGMAYIQQGERIQSARVARNVWGSGGGGEIHIHIEPQKAVIDEHELIAEVDWARRTRRW